MSANAHVGPGWLTLLHKELLRFWKVSFQTIAAPILTSLLYLLIFSHVLESRVAVFDNQVRYTAFLVPGLVMMSVLQNSFANSSSSMIQSKITGNLIFVLLPPLSPLDMYAAYVLGALEPSEAEAFREVFQPKAACAKFGASASARLYARTAP